MQVIRLLILCNANVNAQSLEGKTPLQILEEGRPS